MLDKLATEIQKEEQKEKEIESNMQCSKAPIYKSVQILGGTTGDNCNSVWKYLNE